MATDYKATLNLPVTKFPMRASLGTREEPRAQHWEAEKIYAKLLARNAKGPAFILHEGPPFTNGAAHLGHFLNRALKDIVIRYKAMNGFWTPFGFGWDCHGLPIEHQVAKELREEKKTLPPSALRARCAEFAEAKLTAMREQFRRIGVWASPAYEYKTKEPAYEAEELRSFANFVEQGLVYRDLRPVIWSIPCKTALAEAEIEYHDHTSPSIWVGLWTIDAPATAFVIWTTTPWTIPSNVAVALSPRMDYVEVLHAGKKYIVAASLAQNFIAAAKLQGATLGATQKGSAYEGRTYAHPFMAHKGRVILADFVSAEDGTGCVHIAPGHGMEDYLAGKAKGLEVYSPLDDEGRYRDDGRIPPQLVGLTTLEKDGHSEANDAVIALLKEKHALLAQAAHPHQYPFCWRSKTPIVFRALEQWFIGLDRGGMRQKVLAAVEGARWIPEQGRSRIVGSIESRPDWCISRQRSWGLPIPAFSDASGRRFIDAAVIRALADKVATSGSNIFFEQTASELLAGLSLPSEWPAPSALKPETDTLDVWLDSAASYLALRRAHSELPAQADLYLEGSDQHRGWFQSSLWMNIVSRGMAPYKTVLTHGFILDSDKEKLSKSRGALPFGEMAQKYGADVLRLWAASQNYQGDVILSDEVLASVSASYMTLRNTLRYQLANLNGFDAARESLAPSELRPLDRWALGKASALLAEATAAYESYDFARVYQLTLRFCQATLSAVYHDVIKDRLYTCAVGSLERRSALTALEAIFGVLVRVLAPIMPFTTDEAWAYRQSDSDFAPQSLHLEVWPKEVTGAPNADELAAFDALLPLREKANEKLEVLRQAKTIGKSLEAKLIFRGDVSALERFKADDLSELFIVSGVELQKGEGSLNVEAQKAALHKCPRCWRFVSPAEDRLCDRCQATLAISTSKTHG